MSLDPNINISSNSVPADGMSSVSLSNVSEGMLLEISYFEIVEDAPRSFLLESIILDSSIVEITFGTPGLYLIGVTISNFQTGEPPPDDDIWVKSSHLVRAV